MKLVWSCCTRPMAAGQHTLSQEIHQTTRLVSQGIPKYMNEALQLANQKVEDRARAKRDVFFLANDVLGFDFQPDVHAELFAAFPKFDESKPWVEQSELKDIM